MKAITLRSRALLGLVLFLASCDKTRPSAGTPPDGLPDERATRSTRPIEPDSAITRSSLRKSLDQAKDLPNAEERNSAINHVIEDAVELDPELATEAFNQLTRETGDTRPIQHFAMRLAEHDVDSATAWAKSLETDEERSLAFGNIALVLSSTDPEAAAKLLSDSGVASRDFDVSVVQVVQRWAEKSPENAAAWVVMFDPGEVREAGLKAITSSWIDDNPTAANAWISGIQDPAIHDEAISGMAESILELPESDQAEILRTVSNDIRIRFEKLKAESDEE